MPISMPITSAMAAAMPMPENKPGQAGGRIHPQQILAGAGIGQKGHAVDGVGKACKAWQQLILRIVGQPFAEPMI